MAKTVGGKEYDEEGLIKKTKRRLKELHYGDRTYLPGHKKTEPTKVIPKTNRTKQVEGGLKQAGLTDEEMARFMPKRKK